MNLALALAAASIAAIAVQEATTIELTAFSLSFMLLSMGAVTALAAWCFLRILRGKRHFDPDGTGPAQAPVAGKVEREGGV